MPSSLRPRDQPGPPQGQTVLGVVPPVLASGEWSCQCAVDSSAPWSTSCRRAGVGRLGREWSLVILVARPEGSGSCCIRRQVVTQATVDAPLEHTENFQAWGLLKLHHGGASELPALQ